MNNLRNTDEETVKDATVDVADILRRHVKDGQIEITDPDDLKAFWAEVNQRWDAEFAALPSGAIRRRGVWERIWRRDTR